VLLRPVAPNVGARLLDLLFPPQCAICGRRGAALCSRCLATVRPPDAQRCARCAAPLPDDVLGTGTPAGRCAACRGQPPVALTGVRVAARYEDTIRLTIIELKFHRQRRLAEPLGDLLAGTASPLQPMVDMVAPVPLHPTRQRERGFNQAELLARRCGQRLGRPVRVDLLRRVRATPSQVRLTAAERHANMRGAFAAAPAAARWVAGRTVLLVDDVCTSGATLTAAAAALHEAGAAAVWGAAVARSALGDTALAGPP
jgi:ComF family protein